MAEQRTEKDPSGITYVIGTEEEGRTWIGRETEPVAEAYPVDVEHIEHFAEGIEDPNPLYWSDEFGKQTRWGGRIAPWGVTVLTGEHHVWRPEWMGNTRSDPGLSYSRVPLPGNRLLATDYEIECLIPLRPGDRVTRSTKLVDIIPKTFRLGVGHQIVMETSFRNQTGEVCIKDKRTVFRYRPVEASDKPATK
jgi:acyl dehydratase